MRSLPSLLLCSLVGFFPAAFQAGASDLPSEGIFWNFSPSPIVCLRDVAGFPTEELLPPERSCRADAVLLPSGRLFKIPNRTEFVCSSDSCSPNDSLSSLVFHAASLRKPGHYGALSLEELCSLMGSTRCTSPRDEEGESHGTIR